MIQDLFKGQVSPVAAAGFVGLLSLFTMGGRVFWASPRIPRPQADLVIFFLAGAVLYWLLQRPAAATSIPYRSSS